MKRKRQSMELMVNLAHRRKEARMTLMVSQEIMETVTNSTEWTNQSQRAQRLALAMMKDVADLADDNLPNEAKENFSDARQVVVNKKLKDQGGKQEKVNSGKQPRKLFPVVPHPLVLQPWRPQWAQLRFFPLGNLQRR